ncbi:DUF885 domain-containing protein [Congregibacter sp.]|uniref:DUF885 domain-containing protein n=1 Tax=Congregibacter sp. TaxID=2744308 RepID=UPI0039E5198C
MNAKWIQTLALHLSLFLVALLASSSSQAQVTLVADSGFAFQAISQCETDLRYLNQVSGWQASWPQQWEAVVSSGTADIEQSIDHWSQLPDALATLKQQLLSGITLNQMVPRPVALRVHQQVQDVALALSSANSPYRFTDADTEGPKSWNVLVDESVVAAFSKFELFLRTQYLPKAQSDTGLSTTKGGGECFGAAAVWWTSLDLPPDEIAAMGNRILKENHDALAMTGNTGESVADILNRLRISATTDPTSAEELIRISELALKRAQEKTLSAFSHEASEPISVEPLPVYMQAAFPAGRYVGANNSTPASYVINPSRPNERRLMAEVIAFHEGIPGHHLFAAYPRDKPPIIYESGNSGLGEGWALYSEYVAQELGLFSTPLDVQGMIAKHLWAASRLVVEPGLHAYGWSREEAVQFMLLNTVLSRTEIEIEVDRYLAMPGQSLSYMFGADLILVERERARSVLGDDFDIRAFHEVVLETGVRPLPVLRDDIRAWVAANSAAGHGDH